MANFFNRFMRGFKDEMGIDRTDQNQIHYASRGKQGLDEDSDRLTHMAANHRISSLVRDSLGISNPTYRDEREKRGMGIKSDPVERLGQYSAAPVRDIATDESRSWWWLGNAPQALVNVGAEYAFGKGAPELYRKQKLDVNIGTEAGRRKAESMGKGRVVDGEFKLNPGVKSDNKGNLEEKMIRGGHAAALLFPSGFAANSALGLMTPFGGYTGYEAAVPSQEDPSKTENAVAEVAAKYILGRTGNLLPYSEFSEVRPDVSRGEYNSYKAFKYDKQGDFDLSDGDFTLPTGVLKGTADGIHGPEIQFLGRSMPLTTFGVPVASSIVGGYLGGRMTRNRTGGNLMRNMLAGTTGGTAAGMLAGNLLEAERQRRNELANNPNNVAVGF